MPDPSMVSVRQEVAECVEEVWRTGRHLGLTDSAIEDIFTAVLEEEKRKEDNEDKNFVPNEIETSREKRVDRMWRFKRWGKRVRTAVQWIGVMSAVALVLVLALHTLITLHNPTRKFVTRHIQEWIYPSMTVLREATLPVLNQFPALSQWYTRECIVDNPFFDQPHVDCSSCAQQWSPAPMSRLDNFTDFYYNNCQAAVVADAIPPARNGSWFQMFRHVDIDYEVASGSLKANSDVLGFETMLKKGVYPSETFHFEWKVQKIKSLHILRQYLPRWYFVPKDTEVAFHRHVFVDGPAAPQYAFPLTEFANVLLVQSEGASTIHLEPSPHCRENYKSLEINLKESQVLFYNWIFWRPLRVSGEGVSTLIMNSFY